MSDAAATAADGLLATCINMDTASSIVSVVRCAHCVPSSVRIRRGLLSPRAADGNSNFLRVLSPITALEEAARSTDGALKLMLVDFLTASEQGFLSSRYQCINSMIQV